MTERDATIGKMIDEMLKLRDALVELAERGYVKPADCPIVTGHYDHYDISAILVDGGFGTYEWECPFCGEKFCTYLTAAERPQTKGENNEGRKHENRRNNGIGNP